MLSLSQLELTICSLFEPTDNIYVSLQTNEETTLDHNTVVLNDNVHNVGQRCPANP